MNLVKTLVIGTDQNIMNQDTETKPWSRIRGLRVHLIDAKPNTITHFFNRGEIPDKYLWAYRHIIDHDCGSLSCGKTVFEVVYNEI